MWSLNDLKDDQDAKALEQLIQVYLVLTAIATLLQLQTMVKARSSAGLPVGFIALSLAKLWCEFQVDLSTSFVLALGHVAGVLALSGVWFKNFNRQDQPKNAWSRVFSILSGIVIVIALNVWFVHNDKPSDLWFWNYCIISPLLSLALTLSLLVQSYQVKEWRSLMNGWWVLLDAIVLVVWVMMQWFVAEDGPEFLLVFYFGIVNLPVQLILRIWLLSRFVLPNKQTQLLEQRLDKITIEKYDVQK